VTIRALRDTQLSRFLGDGGAAGTLQSDFHLSQGEVVQVNWIRPAGGDYWEFDVGSPRGSLSSWFVPRADVQVDDAAPLVAPPISTQVKAFLDMISVPEGTSGADGYRVCFTGTLCVPSDFHDHPRVVNCTSSGLCSDAAGRYQFLSTTWDSVAHALGLHDFSPNNQDLGAVELIRQRGALDRVEAGDVVGACQGHGGTTGAAWEWASLPPGRYGQPSITFGEAKRLFIKFGGTLGA
jgi:muramidase (phage lysozyme)